MQIADLAEEYGALLFRVAHSMVRDATEAEDVVQDTLVRVLEHRAALPEVRAMRVWLVSIAWRIAVDRRRRKKPEPMEEVFADRLASSSVSAEQAVSEAQQVRRVMREIDRLPAAERQALLLSAVEELSTAEIGSVCRRSESAVRALLHRGRMRLRERLERAEKGGRR